MSSSSREDSPDWLRSYKAPNLSVVTFSSGSLSPLSDDEDEVKLNRLFKKEVSPEKIEGDLDEDESQHTTLEAKSPSKKQKAKGTPGRKRKREILHEEEGKGARGRAVGRKASENHLASPEPKHSVWEVSSDSDSCPDSKAVNMDICLDKKFPVSEKSEHVETMEDEVAILDDGGEPPAEVPTKETPKKPLRKDRKPPVVENVNALKNGGNSREMDVEEDILEKCSEPNVSSRLPLILSEKVQRTKALVECEGDSIDLSGDVGAVGRVVISDDSPGNHEMLLDLKGTVYRTNILPSRTFCVVTFGQSEAKVEAIMNDFIQLRPESNVYETETMVEGTLEGFSFDSEDDGDELAKATVPANQDEDAEEQPNGKNKQTSKKASGTGGKKGKTAGGKPQKRVRKKPQAPKKGKTKK